MNTSVISICKGIGQILFFIVVSIVMNHIAGWLHLQIPGSILGIVLVFILLQLGWIKLEWVDLGAKWLLAEMLLFFIPSAAGLIDYKELLITSGFKILFVLILSTAAVMVWSGMIAQWIAKYKERKQA